MELLHSFTPLARLYFINKTCTKSISQRGGIYLTDMYIANNCIHNLLRGAYKNNRECCAKLAEKWAKAFGPVCGKGRVARVRGWTHKSDLDRADAPSSVKVGSERASERGVTGWRMGRVGWQARQKAVSQCQRQWVYSGEEKKKRRNHATWWVATSSLFTSN